VRRIRVLAVAAVGCVFMILGNPTGTLAGRDKDEAVVAYLDGHRIPIADVSLYACDDFSYPVIECSSVPEIVETRGVVQALLTGADYVTIYDLTNYGGGFMNLSQDYSALLTIGWNDKISSFKGRNSETGRFWTDWFNTGTSWSFCCNTNFSSLGSYNNTFSSVERT
jgi:hypothetical protein